MERCLWIYLKQYPFLNIFCCDFIRLVFSLTVYYMFTTMVFLLKTVSSWSKVFFQMVFYMLKELLCHLQKLRKLAGLVHIILEFSLIIYD